MMSIESLCNVDSELLTATDTELLLASASHNLSTDSDISASGEVQAAANVFQNKTAAGLDNKNTREWEAPPELYNRRVPPSTTLSFIPAMLQD